MTLWYKMMNRKIRSRKMNRSSLIGSGQNRYFLGGLKRAECPSWVNTTSCVWTFRFMNKISSTHFSCFLLTLLILLVRAVEKKHDLNQFITKSVEIATSSKKLWDQLLNEWMKSQKLYMIKILKNLYDTKSIDRRNENQIFLHHNIVSF